MCQLKEVWKLTLSADPPLNWVARFEVFCRQFRVFFQFVGRVPFFLGGAMVAAIDLVLGLMHNVFDSLLQGLFLMATYPLS